GQRQGDAGATPEQLLGDERQGQPARVLGCLHVDVDGVEPHLGGLLQDVPRELLGLVVVRGDRPYLLLGEVVSPLLQLALLLGQTELHASTPSFSRACGASVASRIALPRPPWSTLEGKVERDQKGVEDF